MRRKVRRRQKQVEAVTDAAEKSIETNLFGRLDRMLRVRRFTFGWLILVALVTACTIGQTLTLSAYYQTVQPTSGGIYNEGLVGTYSNANPLFATGPVDRAVSRLIFAGLFKYNNHNKLVGDLASSYSVDSTGQHYVVHLRHNLTWQDGKPLTAEDVVFTYHLIQNPAVQSPLLSSWQNITIVASNKYTIDFGLPNAFSPFPYGLTTGILPKHLLDHVSPSELRASSFNTTHPVGAGPFAWQAVQINANTDPSKVVDLVALKPFKHYVGGTPKLSGFVIHAFGNKSAMITAFQQRTINAMAGLNEVPASLRHASDVTSISFPSTAAAMVFFKTSSGVLANKPVRQALVEGADTPAILNSLRYVSLPVREPLLIGQLGYNPAYRQASYNQTAANAALDKAGWVRGKNGIRSKNGTALAFSLYVRDTPQDRRTVAILKRNWGALGVDMTPVIQSPTDFQTTLETHDYDALLYSISIGVDPDVYAYWGNNPADSNSPTQMNFSEYQSTQATLSLEAGRTRLNPKLRAIKYVPFLQAWQSDAPALGLYQPRFLYITRGPVYGLTDHILNLSADRYYSVANWEISTKKVTN